MRRLKLSIALGLSLAVAAFDWPLRGGVEAWESASEAQRSSLLRASVGSDDPGARALWLRALTGPDRALRLAAADLVRERRVLEAAPVLARWLDDPAPELRLVAARILGALRSPESLPPLLRSMADADLLVRSESVRAVAAIGGEGAVVPLLDRFADPEASVRELTARALGDIGDARAVFTLLGALQDSAPEVRVAALGALGSIADPRALRGVVAAFHDGVPAVRLAAVQAAGALGHAAPEVVNDLAAVALRESQTWDPAGQARLAIAAVQALIGIGSPEVIAVLIEVVRRGTEASDRTPVREALRGLRSLGPRIRPSVAALVSRTPVEFFDELSVLLGSVGGDEAAESLLAALERPGLSATSRARVLVALGQTGSARALLPLLSEAERTDAAIPDRGCPSRGVDPAAIRGLQQLALARTTLGPEALDLLLSLRARAAGSCERTQIELTRLIGMTGNPRARRALAPQLESGSPGIRRAAVSALYEAGLEGVEAALVARLSDSSEDVRRRSADALARHGTAAALDALLPRWSDAAPLDRAAAARVMGRIAARLPLTDATSARAVSALVACGLSGERIAATACLDALADPASIGQPRALDALTAAAGSPDLEVARAAVEAFANAVTLAPSSRRAELLARCDAALGARGGRALRLERAWASADTDALIGALREGASEAGPNIIASVGRTREAPSLSPEQARALWDALRSPASDALKTNVAMLLARVRTDADDPAAAIRLLAQRGSAPVRLAAARLALELASHATGAQRARLRAALARCVVTDVPEVAAACGPTPPGAPSGAVDVRVMDERGGPAEGAEVDLVLPSGWVRVAVVGVDGWIHERDAGAGVFRVVSRLH